MMDIDVTTQPDDLPVYRKTATIRLQWVGEPFTVTTMEGTTYTIDQSNDHWESGYWVAWPDDGTDPYPIAPSFVRANYKPDETKRYPEETGND